MGRLKTTPEIGWSESKYQKFLIKMFEGVGWWVFNVHGHAMQKQGVPDLYVANPVIPVWLELKVGSNNADPLQKAQINRLIRNRVPAFVLRLRDGIETLEDVEGHILCTICGDPFSRMKLVRETWKSLQA